MHALKKTVVLRKKDGTVSVSVPHFCTSDLAWINRTHWTHQRAPAHGRIHTARVYILCSILPCICNERGSSSNQNRAAIILLTRISWHQKHTHRHLCGSEEIGTSAVSWPERRSENRNEQTVSLQKLKRRMRAALCFLWHSWANLNAHVLVRPTATMLADVECYKLLCWHQTKCTKHGRWPWVSTVAFKGIWWRWRWCCMTFWRHLTC